MAESSAMLFCTPPPICTPTIVVPFANSASGSKANAPVETSPESTSVPITIHGDHDRFLMPPPARGYRIPRAYHTRHRAARQRVKERESLDGHGPSAPAASTTARC